MKTDLATMVALEMDNRWHKEVIQDAIAAWEEIGHGNFLKFVRLYMIGAVIELHEASQWN